MTEQFIPNLEAKPYLNNQPYPEVPFGLPERQTQCMQEALDLYRYHPEIAGLHAMLQSIMIPSFHEKSSPGSVLGAIPIPRILIVNSPAEVNNPQEYLAQMPLLDTGKWMAVGVAHLDLGSIDLPIYTRWLKEVQEIWWASQTIVDPAMDQQVDNIPSGIIENSILVTGTAGAGKSTTMRALFGIYEKIRTNEQPATEMLRTGWSYLGEKLNGIPLLISEYKQRLLYTTQGELQYQETDTPDKLNGLSNADSQIRGFLEPPPHIEILKNRHIPGVIENKYGRLLANMSHALFSPTMKMISRTLNPLLIVLNGAQAKDNLISMATVYENIQASGNGNMDNLIINMAGVFAGSSPYLRSMLALFSKGHHAKFLSSSQAKKALNHNDLVIKHEHGTRNPDFVFRSDVGRIEHHLPNCKHQSGYMPIFDTLKLLNELGLIAAPAIIQTQDEPDTLTAVYDDPPYLYNILEPAHLYSTGTSLLQNCIYYIFEQHHLVSEVDSKLLALANTLESLALCLDTFLPTQQVEKYLSDLQQGRHFQKKAPMFAEYPI